MATVYLETTIPSAWVSARIDPASVYRREATQAWWQDQLGRYDIWTSDAVVVELEQGEWPGQPDALALVEPLRRVPIGEEVLGVARRYIM